MLILLQIQINIVLSVILFFLLGHAYFNMNRKTITNKLFTWVMGLTWIHFTIGDSQCHIK